MSTAKYHNPVTVIEGVGVFNQIVDEFDGEKVILITTEGTRGRFLDAFLAENNLKPQLILDQCVENPTFDSCRALYSNIDFKNATKIVAVGGGSVLDAAKVVSIFNDTCSFDAVEDAIKQGKDLSEFTYIPMVAVPTTAGTGSEVTCWGTVWDDIGLKKYSISNPKLYPEKAYCDPQLTLTLPWETTLSTALDALSHALESIWNNNATDRTRGYAIKAVDLILDNLVPLSNNLDSIELRAKIMSAALNAGLGFSNTKTSVAHALSYYLTLNKNIPHGMACSFSLPHILQVYLEDHSDGVLNQQHLTRIENLYSTLNISTSPSAYGISRSEFDAFFDAGTQSDRMKNSLVNLPRLQSALLANY